MRAHAASERANARRYAHTSVHVYAHVRSLVRSHVHSSVHSFALRSSPRPLATRTLYVHRLSWSFEGIVYEALKKTNIYIYMITYACEKSFKNSHADQAKCKRAHHVHHGDTRQRTSTCCRCKNELSLISAAKNRCGEKTCSCRKLPHHI